ncbi:hypothetical protein [Acidiluteibacter ferrifornacis]|uniref:Uncharacterized protein n=1 Tax=Acidiluteibacter ferrifornacis TaxID=2692424 RepID=A0A6N9NR46_9FLAO|nr:hypothetical protein [Acidiluteibacter ferrifornacis]NBG66885.1 hypothetical protein [Acidiluteibacter ferrifornacis]
MIEVLMTNVKSEILSIEIVQFLEREHPHLKFDFDLEDFNQPYPCGHSILRIEGKTIDVHLIIQQVKSKGMECDFLVDKMCV